MQRKEKAGLLGETLASDESVGCERPVRLASIDAGGACADQRSLALVGDLEWERVGSELSSVVHLEVGGGGGQGGGQEPSQRTKKKWLERWEGTRELGGKVFQKKGVASLRKCG